MRLTQLGLCLVVARLNTGCFLLGAIGSPVPAKVPTGCSTTLTGVEAPSLGCPLVTYFKAGSAGASGSAISFVLSQERVSLGATVMWEGEPPGIGTFAGQSKGAAGWVQLYADQVAMRQSFIVDVWNPSVVTPNIGGGEFDLVERVDGEVHGTVTIDFVETEYNDSGLPVPKPLREMRVAFVLP